LRDELQSSATLPDALDADRVRRLAASRVAVFLDYDGTLTPIVARPELAVAPDGSAELLEGLARHCTVGIISGRDLSDLRGMIDPAGVWMAGSHGFDIRAPDGGHHVVEAARPYAAELSEATDELERAVSAVPGAWVERKAFAVAIHYRQVDDQLLPRLDDMVDRVADAFSGLRRTGGKRIFELRPAIDWDKGRAVWFLLEQIGLARDQVVPVYIGDDDTDEDAFTALAGNGVGIVVTEVDRPTAATQRLRDPDEVRAFLHALASALKESTS
jgi:trehalose 6-phosphate phosphatase